MVLIIPFAVPFRFGYGPQDRAAYISGTITFSIQSYYTLLHQLLFVCGNFRGKSDIAILHLPGICELLEPIQ